MKSIGGCAGGAALRCLQILYYDSQIRALREPNKPQTIAVLAYVRESHNSLRHGNVCARSI